MTKEGVHALKYERLPFFCHRCGHLDHTERDCDKPKARGGELAYGPSLRASPIKRFNGDNAIRSEKRPSPRAASTRFARGAVRGRGARRGGEDFFWRESPSKNVSAGDDSRAEDERRVDGDMFASDRRRGDDSGHEEKRRSGKSMVEGRASGAASIYLDETTRRPPSFAVPVYTVQQPDDDVCMQLVALSDPKAFSLGPRALGTAVKVQEVQVASFEAGVCMGDKGEMNQTVRGDVVDISGDEKVIQMKSKTWRRRDRVGARGDMGDGVERAGDVDMGDQKRKRIPTLKAREMQAGGVEVEEDRVLARKKKGRKGSVSEDNDPIFDIKSAEVTQQPRRWQ